MASVLCFGFQVYGILAHLLETEPALPALEGEVFHWTTRGKSWVRHILYTDNEQFKKKIKKFHLQ